MFGFVKHKHKPNSITKNLMEEKRSEINFLLSLFLLLIFSSNLALYFITVSGIPFQIDLKILCKKIMFT